MKSLSLSGALPTPISVSAALSTPLSVSAAGSGKYSVAEKTSGKGLLSNGRGRSRGDSAEVVQEGLKGASGAEKWGLSVSLVEHIALQKELQVLSC